MIGLLVSVRSAAEARAALLGGASVIDVKEPGRGPLGMADPALWRAVRQEVPAELPVSVALGEQRDWFGRNPPPPKAFDGLAFRKIGLAGAGPRWAENWAALRREWGGATPWIAVVYADWEAAQSPHPDAVIEAAAEARCAGVLMDTWEKTLGHREDFLGRVWIERFRRIRDFGGLVALAGGLDDGEISRLAPLGPDLFAVRGAACAGGDRLGLVDRERVAGLVRACASPPGR